MAKAATPRLRLGNGLGPHNSVKKMPVVDYQEKEEEHLTTIEVRTIASKRQRPSAAETTTLGFFWSSTKDTNGLGSVCSSHIDTNNVGSFCVNQLHCHHRWLLLSLIHRHS
jgi:hypothetical protein